MPPTPIQTYSVDALPVRVYAQQSDLAADAALIAQSTLNQAISQHGRAHVIFACATSQMKFLNALTALKEIDWNKITTFHMDEYLGLPDQHPASFRRFLREYVVDKARPATVHYLAGDAMQPIAECDRYTDLLRAQPIDLCCLGIGENGHVAFNDPPVAQFQDPRLVKIVKLDEASRRQQVGEGFYPSLQAVPQYALTLTIPALCLAKTMLCIVPEKRKAVAVKETLRGPITTACPATILRPRPQATLFLDADSASLL